MGAQFPSFDFPHAGWLGLVAKTQKLSYVNKSKNKQVDALLLTCTGLLPVGDQIACYALAGLFLDAAQARRLRGREFVVIIGEALQGGVQGRAIFRQLGKGQHVELGHTVQRPILAHLFHIGRAPRVLAAMTGADVAATGNPQHFGNVPSGLHALLLPMHAP